MHRRDRFTYFVFARIRRRRTGNGYCSRRVRRRNVHNRNLRQRLTQRRRVKNRFRPMAVGDLKRRGVGFTGRDQAE